MLRPVDEAYLIAALDRGQRMGDWKDDSLAYSIPSISVAVFPASLLIPWSFSAGALVARRQVVG